MFRAVPMPIIRSFPLYIRHWYMSCKFDDSFQARLVVLESRKIACSCPDGVIAIFLLT